MCLSVCLFVRFAFCVVSQEPFRRRAAILGFRRDPSMIEAQRTRQRLLSDAEEEEAEADHEGASGRQRHGGGGGGGWGLPKGRPEFLWSDICIALAVPALLQGRYLFFFILMFFWHVVRPTHRRRYVHR